MDNKVSFIIPGGRGIRMARAVARMSGVIDERLGALTAHVHNGSDAPGHAGLLQPILLQRAGEALTLAQAVLSLPSDAASYTTGAMIDVLSAR